MILRISGKIKDKLEYHGKARNLQNHYEFKELLDILYNRPWVVYTKEAFQGADSRDPISWTVYTPHSDQ